MSFTAIGRMLAIANALAFPALAVWKLLPPGSAGWLGVYGILAGILLGIVEVPTLCSCAKVCRVVAQYTRFLGGYWITRALIHWGVAAGGLAVYILNPDDRSIPLLLCLLSPIVTGSLYLLGRLWKKEADPGPFPDIDIKGTFSKLGGGASGGAAGDSASGASKGASNPFGGLGKLFSRGSGGAGAGSGSPSASGGATAPSASMFGGNASPSDEAPPASSDKTSLFSGGGLFGGAASGTVSVGTAASVAAVAAVAGAKAAKYGMGGDDESNPFLS